MDIKNKFKDNGWLELDNIIDMLYSFQSEIEYLESQNEQLEKQVEEKEEEIESLQTKIDELENELTITREGN